MPMVLSFFIFNPFAALILQYDPPHVNSPISAGARCPAGADQGNEARH
jgi:hypothetical protein